MFDHLIQFIRDWYQTGAFIPLHEPRFYETDRQYVMDAIDSTFVSSVGAYVDRFETQLAASMGIEYAIATVNGTAALQVALQLAGAGPDTEVITQPMTFVATANAIVYNGARPVFIDIEEQTLGMSPEALNQFLDQYGQKTAKGIWNRETGNRIAAILPMHTFGHPCRMDEILDVADAWGIPVVEDAAEAI
ncbi:MAG: aminotransferase DegT, partial [Desulfobacteraceae bacterium]